MSTELAPVVDRETSTFELVPQAMQLAGVLAKTEFVPPGLRNRPDACAAAMLKGHELGVPPMHSLTSIHVIDGRPGLAAELMRALVMQRGHEIWFEDQTITKVTICGKRKGSEHVTKVTWTNDDVKRAKLEGRQNHQRYPRAMLIARATSELCRTVFPDVIGGLYSIEEIEDGFDFDMQPEVEQPDPAATKRRKASKAATRKAPAKPAERDVIDTTATDGPPPPPLPGEEESPPASPSPGSGATGDDSAPADDPDIIKRAQRIAMGANDVGIDHHELIYALTAGAKTSAKEVTRDEAEAVFEAIRQIKVGEKVLDTSGDEPQFLDAPEQPAAEETPASESDPHTWSTTQWREEIKRCGQKVVPTVTRAKELAKELGEPIPANLADLEGRQSLCAMLLGWLEEHAEGGDT